MRKEIFLKKLSLRNFKGIREFTADFDRYETIICGDNGIGKTTVFDAFTWLLFGKDSTGRSDSNFNIKTLDPSGKPILKLEHEVTATISVDNVDVTLQRIYKEKWEKPRGTNKEVLKGHYTEFFFNGVKLSTKKEYDTIIADIIPEDVFRMITSPFYFPSLPPATQKTILLDMVGDVSDDEIATLKPEYAELLNQLSGKGLEFFKKEIASKKKAIKEQLDQIPARIDTANQLMPESEDWSLLETEIFHKKKKIAEIDAQIADKSKLLDADFAKKDAIQKKIGKKRLELLNLENTIRAKATEATNKADNEIRDIDNKIQLTSNDLNHKRIRLSTLNTNIQEIESELQSLRDQYKKINNDQLTYPDGAFECPTCNRPLEVEDIESKRIEFQENFNKRKSDLLQKNKSDGLNKSNEKKRLLVEKDTILQDIANLESNLLSLQNDKKNKQDNMPESQDVDSLINSNVDYLFIKKEITYLEEQLGKEHKSIDTSELQEGKKIISEAIDELTARLAKRDTIDKTQKLINDLEESRLINNQALSDLERMEFIAQDFQKAKDNELLNRINGMFSIVSFSFIDEQINGGEKITCVCTVNGVPYPDVNNAGKINAGLDIINSICRNKRVTAPIFIDNSESINEIRETCSQKILLRVTHHHKLTVIKDLESYVQEKKSEQWSNRQLMIEELDSSSELSDSLRRMILDVIDSRSID